MEHRWHWTLDESNPGRVTVYAYAKAVGRNESTIHRYAHGHALMLADSASIMRPGDAVERAGMSAETAARQGREKLVAEPGRLTPDEARRRAGMSG